MPDIMRRGLCRQLTGLAAYAACSPALLANTPDSKALPLLSKQLPGKSETISAIGMGTWITFDVPDTLSVRRQRTGVLQTFFDLGGQMIDSSPMYGQAEDMLGHGLARVDQEGQLFAASKIWTPFAADGRKQMGETEKLWGRDPMDLMYVHNLLSWRKHLPQIQDWKSEGRIRYTGISTSHGRRHEELESVLKTESIDFIQLTLNIDQIQAEDRLLPLAADRGVAVVINRPFARGALLDKYQVRPLPALAKELGCQNWPQYLLLYVISHSAVTCAIPATSKIEHMQENMGTLTLDLPDERTRSAMRSSVA
ncbi:MAG: aldo/keto reductase [Granulosicoccus sp.]